MASQSYLSLDKRVNLQVAPLNQNEIKVWVFINLQKDPVDNPNYNEPDLDDAVLASCVTFREDCVAENEEYKSLIKKYGFDYKNGGRITIFRFRTTGTALQVEEKCIELPIEREYWVLTGLKHAVVAELSPTGDANSTAQGEAL